MSRRRACCRSRASPLHRPGAALRPGVGRWPTGSAGAGWTAAACAARWTDVGLHGLDRDEQLARHLLVRVSRARSVASPRARAGTAGRARSPRLATMSIDSGERVQDEAGQPGREHRVAVGHAADGVDQLGPPLIDLVTYPRAPARITPITSSAASETDTARNLLLRHSCSCTLLASPRPHHHRAGGRRAGRRRAGCWPIDRDPRRRDVGRLADDRTPLGRSRTSPRPGTSRGRRPPRPGTVGAGSAGPGHPIRRAVGGRVAGPGPVG